MCLRACARVPARTHTHTHTPKGKKGFSVHQFFQHLWPAVFSCSKPDTQDQRLIRFFSSVASDIPREWVSSNSTFSSNLRASDLDLVQMWEANDLDEIVKKMKRNHLVWFHCSFGLHKQDWKWHDFFNGSYHFLPALMLTTSTFHRLKQHHWYCTSCTKTQLVAVVPKWQNTQLTQAG